MRVNLLRSKSQLVRNFIFKQDGIRGKLSLEATMLFILKQKKSCPKILNGKIMVTRWSQLFRLRTLVNTLVCLRLVKLLVLLLSNEGEANDWATDWTESAEYKIGQAYAVQVQRKLPLLWTTLKTPRQSVINSQMVLFKSGG